ncbi:hypothetical protein L7F22_014134 [Adiantum nelumboides]|nr:hypothetical protein [Adiantum nelumboides]
MTQNSWKTRGMEAHSEGKQGASAESARNRKKEEENGEHVSETELLIAGVLAAMKYCALSSEEPKSSSIQISPQAKAAAQMLSQANAPTTQSKAPSSALASPKTATASQIIPQAKNNQASSHSVADKLSQAVVEGQASSITSVKNTHNKENSAPPIFNIDMQDERAQPKFRSVVDLYQIRKPQTPSEAL